MSLVYQKTPYGFNTLCIGSLTVYCGKVRIKGIQFTTNKPYLNVSYNDGYCTISFEVIDKQLAIELYNIVGRTCREVAQSRLDSKWSWLAA